MDRNILFEVIETNTESEYMDFKKNIYDFSKSEQKEEFLKDILAMANSVCSSSIRLSKAM